MHRWICLLLLSLIPFIVALSSNIQAQARSQFCFFKTSECGNCFQENVKGASARYAPFLKVANTDVLPINKCITPSERGNLSFAEGDVLIKPTRSLGRQQAPAQPGGQDSHELAKKLSNPVASLISVPFQQNFDFGMGAGSGWRSTLNIQPVIPISLSPKWNLISRTILPIIHQHNVVPNSSQTGLGDITQSFFFSPTDSKRAIWGAGPAILIPTATDDALGTEKFGLGPTALVLKQQGGWTYGALVNHIWSVAGSDTRSDVNSTFLQPFLAYNTKDAWTFSLNTESNYDWEGNNWNVPINFVISKLIKIGHRPVSVGGGIKCWAASAPGGPENCGLRMIFTPLFPR